MDFERVKLRVVDKQGKPVAAKLHLHGESGSISPLWIVTAFPMPSDHCSMMEMMIILSALVAELVALGLTSITVAWTEHA